MSIVYDVRAKTDTDKEGKGIFKSLGRVIETKSGLMIKFDVLPLSWDGWAYLNKPLEKVEDYSEKSKD